MILKINAEGFDISEDLMKYARSKLYRLDRYILRKDRATTLAEVTFSEQGKSKTCDLSVKLRREEFEARESTQHIYASLDVAAAAVEQRLRDYRKQHPGPVRSYIRQKRSELS